MKKQEAVSCFPGHVKVANSSKEQCFGPSTDNWMVIRCTTQLLCARSSPVDLRAGKCQELHHVADTEYCMNSNDVVVSECLADGIVRIFFFNTDVFATFVHISCQGGAGRPNKSALSGYAGPSNFFGCRSIQTD